MRFTHLILSAVAVTASPIATEGDAVDIGANLVQEHTYPDSKPETSKVLGKIFSGVDDKLKTIIPRASAPIDTPTIEWDVEAEEDEDQATEEIGVEDDGNNGFEKKPKKTKKPKKPQKTKRPITTKTRTRFITKTETKTKTETATVIPIPPIPTST